MADIQQRVRDAVSDGNAVAVVITCSGRCAPVADRLEAAGVPVGRGAVDLGILSATIGAAELAALSADPDVSAVEIDGTVKTQ